MRNQVQLYVNEQLVDLTSDTRIRINLKAHELGETSTVWVNYTNTFYLEMTPVNIRTLAFALDDRTTSSLPYELNEVKLIQNGVELIANGTMSISVVKDRFEVIIYEELDGFFSKIKDKYISEIQTADVGVFDDAFISSKRNSTSGVCCPVIDYGNTTFDGFGGIYLETPFYLPSFSYKSILEAIFDNAGYPSGQRQFDFFDPADTLSRMALPFGRDKFEYSSKFLNARSFYANTDVQTIAFPGGASAKRIDFVDLKDGYNSLGWYDGVNEWSKPATPYDFNVKEVMVRITFTVTGMGGGDTLDLKLFEIYGTETYNIPSNGTYSITVSGNLFGTPAPTIAAQIYCYFDKTGAGASLQVTIASGEFHLVVSPQPIDLVYYPGLLPDIKQTDFIKDFITRYFLSLYEKNGVIRGRSFDKIILDEGNAVDWTQKRAAEIVDWKYFKGLNYAQVNRFSYADKLYGTGSFSIPNRALDDSQDTFVSPFNSVATLPYLGGNTAPPLPLYSSIAKIPLYDATSVLITDLKGKAGATLVLLRDAKPYDIEVHYNGSLETSYQVAYFIDSASPELPSLRWNYLLNLNAKFLIKALQQLKLIFRYYYLNDADIQQFSFHKPLFDKDSLYLVNSIDDYVAGKPTRAQLLRLSFASGAPTTIALTQAGINGILTSADGAASYTVDWPNPPLDGPGHFLWTLSNAGFPGASAVSPAVGLPTLIPVHIFKNDNGGLSTGTTTINFSINAVVIHTVIFTIGQMVDVTYNFGPFAADNPSLGATITET